MPHLLEHTKLILTGGTLKQVLNPSVTYYAGVNVVTMQINRVQVPLGYYLVKIWAEGTVKTFKILLL